ncbi:MAG: GNAT family N-acetyltransferase, partial [Gemmatimonadales bacterium]|nr:GNAT family N-acetyltransferase [Gemmatimonadales bacterium]
RVPPHFERLNREWIERHFVLEPPDLEVFRDPEGQIIAPGGQIFFVVDDEGVRGTCAVLPQGGDSFELAKMAVEPAARGRGYGDLLMRAAIAFARQAGARRLTLVSNTALESAIRLYKKYGFVAVPIHTGHGYGRVDIQMELELPENARTCFR